jgi:ferredoxin
MSPFRLSRNLSDFIRKNTTDKYILIKNMREIKIDKEKCIGCDACSALCPNVFKMNYEEIKAEVYNKTGDTEENIQMALNSCPTQAIYWE